LRSLENTSNFTEQPKEEEIVGKKNKVKEEETGNRHSSTNSVNSGSGPDYKINIQI
jgi:hypothetical protein